MKWSWIWASILAISYPLLAQDKNQSIEIDGLQVRPGMTVSDALLLLKGRQLTRTGTEIQITVPITSHDGAGKEIELRKIKGTLSIANEAVIGACRPWDYSDNEDAELARVLFAAVNGTASTETSQSAIVTTSVARKAEWTAEYLTIQIGQRTIDVTRQQYHSGKKAPTIVFVKECLWKNGDRPLVGLEAAGKH